MWQVLRQPRWLAYLLLAVLFGVATAFLGSWQMERHEQRVDRRELIETNYLGDPRPLVEVLPPGEELNPGQEWTRVQVRGSYVAEDQHLVRNRPHQRVYGYQVLVPLRTDAGQVLAVDRGWVPNAPSAAEAPDAPAPPQGEVEVVGWLRPSEPDLGRDLPDGQLASIDLPRLEAATGLDLADAYLVLETEDPAPAERPAQLDPPDTGLGSHFAYALQWWLTVPVGMVLVLVMARREAKDEEDQDAEEPALVGSGTPGRTGSAPAGKPRRPRKVRIWDEEDY